MDFGVRHYKYEGAIGYSALILLEILLPNDRSDVIVDQDFFVVHRSLGALFLRSLAGHHHGDNHHQGAHGQYGADDRDPAAHRNALQYFAYGLINRGCRGGHLIAHHRCALLFPGPQTLRLLITPRVSGRGDTVIIITVAAQGHGVAARIFPRSIAFAFSLAPCIACRRDTSINISILTKCKSIRFTRILPSPLAFRGRLTPGITSRRDA